MTHRQSVQIKLLDSRLGNQFPLPAYATTGSAGLDLRAMLEEPLVLAPGQSKLVPSGVSIYIKDPAFVGLIIPRSGLGHKKGLVLGNLTGVIDADYQGPLMISLWNRSSEDVRIEPGDAVAQFLVMPVTHADLVVVDEFDAQTIRGSGGFGHTGNASALS